MEFKVGDYIAIREWDDMANEFGLDEEGDIRIVRNDLNLYFIKDMLPLCGKTFKIQAVNNYDDSFQIEDFPQFTIWPQMVKSKSADKFVDKPVDCRSPIRHCFIDKTGKCYSGDIIDANHIYVMFTNKKGTYKFPFDDITHIYPAGER